jgi:hypothetical protein
MFLRLGDARRKSVIGLYTEPLGPLRYVVHIFLNQAPIFDWCGVRWGSKNKRHKRHRSERDRTTSLNPINSPHSTMSIVGRTFVFEQEINKHVCWITISKSGEVRFPHWLLLILHRRFANATQGLDWFVSIESVEVGDHEIRTKLTATHTYLQGYDRGEPAVSYRWTGWVWELTGWSSRLQENYQSL